MKSRNILIKILAIMLCSVVALSIMNVKVNAEDAQRSGKVIVKYQDKEGNVLLEEATKEGSIGDKYEIVRKNIKGYKAYGVTPKEAKGEYTDENIEVVFTYQKIKSEEVVVKYIDKDGNYIRRDKTIVGNKGDSYETTADDVSGYKVTKTDGKEKGEITEEGQEITYTYKVYNKDSSKTEWTTEKTLITIAGIIVVLIVVFVIIAKVEKKNKKKEENVEEQNQENKED